MLKAQAGCVNLHPSKAMKPTNKKENSMKTQTETHQAAELESIIVAWVNENADRIKALAAFRSLAPDEMGSLVEEFKSAQ